MSDTRITLDNIESYRGNIKLKNGDLNFEMWSIFDRQEFEICANGMIVSLDNIVSTKNQLNDPKFRSGEKADPRHTAFLMMTAAGRGEQNPRKPIEVTASEKGEFLVLDGNATVQVLMLAGWKLVPVCLTKN